MDGVDATPALEAAPVVRRDHGVSAELRSLSTFDSADYVDVFTVTMPGVDRWSPEVWARTAIEDFARRARPIWKGVLGLRLEPVSAHNVGGWPIAARGEDWIRLAAGSWVVSAELVIRVAGDEATVATFGHFVRPLVARPVWAAIGGAHRDAVPRLLLRAARILAKSEEGAR